MGDRCLLVLRSTSKTKKDKKKPQKATYAFIPIRHYCVARDTLKGDQWGLLYYIQ